MTAISVFHPTATSTFTMFGGTEPQRARGISRVVAHANRELRPMEALRFPDARPLVRGALHRLVQSKDAMGHVNIYNTPDIASVRFGKGLDIPLC